MTASGHVVSPTAVTSPAGELPPPGPPPVVRRGAVDLLRSAFRWFGTRSPAMVFLLSLVSGLIVSSLLIVLTDEDVRTAWGGLFTHPLNALQVTGRVLGNAYGALLEGALGSPEAFSAAFSDPSAATWTRALTPLGNTITAAVPLAIAGMGLAIAYRSAAFNIGGHAQVALGGIGASWVGFSFPDMPWFPHVLLALLAAAIGGGLGGLLPGLLRALTGASEVIVTIMLNYVVAYLLTWILSSTFFKASSGGVDNPVGRTTVESASLTDMIGNWPVNAGAVIALLVIGLGAVLLNRSRLGFVLQIAGASPRAARVVGIRQSAVYVAAFVISGAVVGLAGAVQVLGVSNQLTTDFGTQIGALAILVAFVGNNRPLGVLLAALLYGALQAGGLNMQFASGISYQLTSVMQGLIVMFVTAPAFIAGVYRLREPRTSGAAG